MPQLLTLEGIEDQLELALCGHSIGDLIAGLGAREVDPDQKQDLGPEWRAIIGAIKPSLTTFDIKPGQLSHSVLSELEVRSIPIAPGHKWVKYVAIPQTRELGSKPVYGYVVVPRSDPRPAFVPGLGGEKAIPNFGRWLVLGGGIVAGIALALHLSS